jgi:5-methyltetrahydrofolate--homocysteine methyltransferase
LKPGECPDSWNLTTPRIVEKIVQMYVEAGSKIILTNTFSANRLSLRSYGLEEKTKEINLAGCKIAKKAAQESAYIFGSMGPTGRMFAANDIDEEELFITYAEQVQSLGEGGVDAIIIESMTDLREAKIALKAAKEAGIPVGVSMEFDSGRDKNLTMMGNSPEQIAEELTDAGADIIGANCGLGIEGYIPILKRMRSATDKPIWMKPSAGLPKIIQRKIVYPTSAQNFAQYAKVLTTHGTSFIGGCCGTTHEYIILLRKLIPPK